MRGQPTTEALFFCCVLSFIQNTTVVLRKIVSKSFCRTVRNIITYKLSASVLTKF